MAASRAAPRRSPIEVEVSHLLRNLDSPQALCANLLIEPLVGTDRNALTLGHVRALVERQLDAMARDGAGDRARARRRREILLRYDIGGESGKKVAADLGLSRRHFYRERRAATLDLGARLRRLRPPAEKHTYLYLDLFEAAEAAAYAVDLAGVPAHACTKFLVLATTTRDVGKRVRALCDAARVMIDLFDFAGAERVLREARRSIVEMSPSSAAEGEQAKSALELTSAVLQIHAPAAIDAYQLARPAFQRARRYVHEFDASGLHSQVRERLRHANRLACNGYGAEARLLMHECRPLLDLLAGRVAYLETAYAGIRAAVALEVDGPNHEVVELASTALRLARQDGNFMIAAYAGLTLSTALAASGLQRAVPVARAALELAANSNSPNLLAHARLRVANVLNELGHPAPSAELAAQVIATEHLSPRFKLQARLARAQSLLQFGEVATAQAEALECYRQGGDYDRGLVRGLALRTMAESAKALDQRREATTLLGRALETLEAGNHARMLSFVKRGDAHNPA